jgi:hypothetical protein
VTDDGESYAYYDKLTLYTYVNASRAPSPSDHIAAEIKWVVCKDICIAGRRDVKSTYGELAIKHEWPKLPLVETLEAAGYSFAPSNFGVGYSNGTGAHVLEFYKDTARIKISRFFPMTLDDRPILLLEYNGDLELRYSMPRSEAEQSAVSENQSFDRVNGLVFIGDKVYWLKAP